MSNIYIVRLTEEEREAALGFSGTMNALAAKIESARPEHPERQAAMERLKEAVGIVRSQWKPGSFNGPINGVMQAYDRLRSLEAK